MKVNPFSFVSQYFQNFLTAFSNLCRFLPYFFSVSFLFRTLFSPWKRVYAVKTKPGFSFEEWTRVASFNLISSFIGCTLRLFLMCTYLCIQLLLFLFFIPALILYLCATLVIFYPLTLLQPTQEKVKEQLKKNFLNLHLLKEENRNAVTSWFEHYYLNYVQKKEWWNLSQLFVIPPIARDWHMGFTVTLDRYGEELTKPTPYKHHLVGRKKEIAQIEQVLSKSAESNVVIVGEEGVGKQTIIQELAKRVYYGQTKGLLAYKRIIVVLMEKILSESVDKNQKEELVRLVFSEAAAAGNIILVIRELDRYVSSESGRIDLSAVMEPFAKTSNVQCIGITTPFLFQKYIFPNEKIRRIFQKIDVGAVQPNEALEILMDAAYTFEKRFNVILPYETLTAIVEKSEYYITHIPFPEKAIELLDEICATVSQNKKTDGTSVVNPSMVDQVLSQKIHVPTTLSEETKTKLNTLESALSEQIIDQPEAVQKTASTLRRSFLLINKRKKPFATLLFLGPTGVGKTQTAKTLARFFFGSEKYLYRFDMSSYQSKDDIPNLIGSGDKNLPGLLTQSVRNNPYGVLLLDELEKANRDLINIFLTIFDEGYFTDGFGKPVDCKNLIIVATSNAGSDQIYEELSRYDNPKEEGWLINYLVSKKIFSPEFLNRFDQIVLYQPLEKESIFKIAKREVEKIGVTIKKLYHVNLTVTDTFLATLIERGYDRKFGARNMERLIHDNIEDRLAKMILEKKVKEGDTVTL
jgi:ATP-dependent Clp protease ATP-binding subunit ClpA